MNSNALRFNTAPRLRILLTLLKTLLEPFRRTILSSPAIFKNEALLLRFSNIHILKLWRHWFIFSIHSWNAQHLCICVNVNKVALHVATNTLGANNRPKFSYKIGKTITLVTSVRYEMTWEANLAQNLKLVVKGEKIESMTNFMAYSLFKITECMLEEKKKRKRKKKEREKRERIHRVHLS